MTLPQLRERRWILVALAWGIPLLATTGPILFGDQTFGFRDATHYYRPLLHAVREQWQSGLPLWNPWEERGRPLLADPTAAALYPGQLVFLLPLSFSRAYALYVSGHLIVACGTMYFAARWLSLDAPAATLAGVTYAFGGSVLFQTCNPPYLIGAAWLPWGLQAVLAVVQAPGWRPIGQLALVLTLLVLGGDPQLAYLLGIASGLAVLLRRASTAPTASLRDRILEARYPLKRLALAGLLGLGLSAAQWIPTLEWTLTSDRLHASKSAPVAETSDNLAPTRRASGHSGTRYYFSVGPWRWPELLWPELGGRPFPQNARWMSAIPAEGQCWTPSLYMGLVPVLLLLGGARQVGCVRPERRWLRLLVAAGILGSLGRYGLGWLLNELNPVDGQTAMPQQEAVGGIYWLMVRLLPGFGLFRYPAKLWTWTAAGISLLAAARMDGAIRERRFPIRNATVMIYGSLSLALLVIIAAARGELAQGLQAAPGDSLFGPLQIGRVESGLYRSFTHGVILAALIGTLQIAQSATREAAQRWSLVLLTSLELALVHAGLVPQVPEATNRVAPPRFLAADTHVDARPTVYRTRIDNWYPRSWSQVGSPDRLAQCVAWDRSTARPKYPIEQHWMSLQSSTSFSSREHRALLMMLQQCRIRHPHQFAKLLETLGVHTIVAPPNSRLPGLQPVATSDSAWPSSDAALWRTRRPLPRAWIVHEAIAEATDIPGQSEDPLARLESALIPNGIARDFSRLVVLEPERVDPRASSSDPRSKPTGSRANEPGETCQVTEATGNVVRLEVRMRTAGWVVLNDSFLPGWTAVRVTPEGDVPLPVLRANRIMRAVQLPAGESRLVFRYRPWSVRVGIAISVATLLAVTLGVLASSSRLGVPARV